MKNKLLLKLKEQVNTCNISEITNSSDLFGGANISIVYQMPKLESKFYPNPKYVVTTHAKELSWLIFQIKDIFKDDIDYLNKYNFYGRLADRANSSLKNSNINIQNLLNDVIDEALIIVKL